MPAESCNGGRWHFVTMFLINPTGLLVDSVEIVKVVEIVEVVKVVQIVQIVQIG